MKIALCFAGQPRFINECAPYILSSLVDGNDVEVFAHLWFDEDLTTKPYKYGGDGGWKDQRISENAIDEFKTAYSPISLKVEKGKKFVDKSIKTDFCFRKSGDLVNWTRHWRESESIEPDYRNRMINNWLSNHYSIMQSMLLKKEHEYQNDMKYDWVIKCRTDIQPRQKIPFDNLSKDLVYYTSTMNQPDGMINDWLNFGNSKNMDSFMNVFGNFDNLLEECKRDFTLGGAWSNEMLHRKALDIFRIKSCGLPIPITLPRF